MANYNEPWNKGKTKVECPTLGGGRQKGCQVWNTGLTAETDRRVAGYTRRQKRTWKFKKGHTPEVKALIAARGQEHQQAIRDEAARYESMGYAVLVVDRLRPDLIVRKDGQVLAIEVEFSEPNTAKYDGQTLFDDIVWLRKEWK